MTVAAFAGALVMAWVGVELASRSQAVGFAVANRYGPRRGFAAMVSVIVTAAVVMYAAGLAVAYALPAVRP